jgi:hypothetical protein
MKPKAGWWLWIGNILVVGAILGFAVIGVDSVLRNVLAWTVPMLTSTPTSTNAQFETPNVPVPTGTATLSATEENKEEITRIISGFVLMLETQEVLPENWNAHLTTAYANAYLLIYGSKDGISEHYFNRGRRIHSFDLFDWDDNDESSAIVFLTFRTGTEKDFAETTSWFKVSWNDELNSWLIAADPVTATPNPES